MRRKLIGALGALCVFVVVAGAALAWYTGTGTGSGTAAAGTSPQSVLVSAAVSPQAGDPEAALYPGDTADVAVTVSAPAAWPDARRARIGSASASVDSTSLPAGCLSTWFVFTPSGFSPGFVTGTTPFVFTAGTLTFTDEAVDQSACSDATLDLDATVGP